MLQESPLLSATRQLAVCATLWKSADPSFGDTWGESDKCTRRQDAQRVSESQTSSEQIYLDIVVTQSTSDPVIRYRRTLRSVDRQDPRLLGQTRLPSKALSSTRRTAVAHPSTRPTHPPPSSPPGLGDAPEAPTVVPHTLQRSGETRSGTEEERRCKLRDENILPLVAPLHLANRKFICS